MASPYGSYRTDTDLENKGIWLEEPEFRIKIRRAGGSNKQFQLVTERVMRPLRRAIQTNQLSEDVAQQKLAEILAEAVVIDWQVRDPEGSKDLDKATWLPGIHDPETGEVVPFSRETVQRVLQHATELTSYIQGQAKDPGLFREDVEGDLGN